MNENTIAAFLSMEINVETLASVVRNSEHKLDLITTAVTVSEMKSEFVITRTMALRLCDAVLNETLQAEVLRTVAFVIVSSDHLTWGDDDLLGDILCDWSCPEVNYPLTPENMVRCRKWLDGIESYPPKGGSIGLDRGTLISRLIRKHE